jgi:hypothetical protein
LKIKEDSIFTVTRCEKVASCSFSPIKIIFTDQQIHLVSNFGELLSYKFSSNESQNNSLISSIASNISTIMKRSGPSNTPPSFIISDSLEKCNLLNSVKERTLVFKHPSSPHYFYTKGFCNIYFPDFISTNVYCIIVCGGYWDNSFRYILFFLLPFFF